MPAAFVSDPARRVEIARMILSQLPEWFGIPAATELSLIHISEPTRPY